MGVNAQLGSLVEPSPSAIDSPGEARVDVTSLPATDLDAFVSDAVGEGDHIHLERRAGQTFLVLS